MNVVYLFPIIISIRTLSKVLFNFVVFIYPKALHATEAKREKGNIVSGIRDGSAIKRKAKAKQEHQEPV